MDQNESPLANSWHTATVEETAALLQSDAADGLTETEARSRAARGGLNTLTEEKHETFWEEFFEELREPMVLMLLVTGVLYALWGELADAIIIFAIILSLNTVEVLNEQRSKKAIAGLRKLAEPTAEVLRDGVIQEIPVEQVVPGDLIFLQSGHRVPADARLVSGSGLLVDESALTGESLPVEKNPAPLGSTVAPLAERKNMLYSATLISRGKGTALVVATGMQTEIGRITGLTRQVKEPRTPLQQIMGELSRTLVWFALGFSVLVPLIGVLVAYQPIKDMVLTGLSLAFATIPEELPIIITMVLALGASRLSKHGAIVKRLQAVESLGSVTVIATDKTGTLTENRLEAAQFEPAALQRDLLEIGVLCNDAVLMEGEYMGDPVDAALLRSARKAGLDVAALQAETPIVASFPFDSSRKLMSTVVMSGGQRRAAVKGAPEAVLAQCTRRRTGSGLASLTDADRVEILEQVEAFAADGLRVLAFAERLCPEGKLDQAEVETDLTFVGLVGLADPPRLEAAEAIANCRRAGVRVMMITGDHPLTASSIARQVGLDGTRDVVTGPELDQLSDGALQNVVREASIFARTTPEHKLRIVQTLQAQGERVAVTGDGINDAPALAAADIGVAMAKSGTDVAREASDMLLTDDNFTTIVHAVKEGRLIYENLKKGVRYYLTCKLALVLITLLPTLLLVPVPFAPVQIILMELFMDLMAAAAFVAEAPEADLLEQQPRDPQAKFMDGHMTRTIVTSSLGLFAAVSALYLWTWYGTQDVVTAQTVAFFAWLVGHVLLALNMRSERQPIFQLGVGSNRMMLIWGAAVAGFLVLLNLIPGAQDLIGVTSLTGLQWAMVLGATFLGTFWMELRKLLTFHRQDESMMSGTK